MEGLKIYYNIIIALKYLKKINVRIEDLNLKDIYTNQRIATENLQEQFKC